MYLCILWFRPGKLDVTVGKGSTQLEETMNKGVPWGMSESQEDQRERGTAGGCWEGGWRPPHQGTWILNCEYRGAGNDSEQEVMAGIPPKISAECLQHARHNVTLASA